MKRIAICKHCGEPFEYEVKRGRVPGFCCEEHRHLGLNKRTNENQKKHRKCTCKVCGKQYNYVNGKGNGWYCSDECYRSVNPSHICQQCGKEFPHKRNTDNQFCSRKCYQNHRKEHPELYKSDTAISSEPLRLTYQCICECCGKPFETDSIQKKYCSQECQYKAGIQKAIERQHDRNVANFKPKLIKCKECGTEFVKTFGDTRRSFCSIKCMNKWRGKQGNKNREMRMRGALVDKDITLKEVARRDNDICYLCGHPVDWNDCSNDNGVFLVGPNYPSVEHVIPIAKGGKHAWDNVRLAHCYCNTLKSDKIL